ncbi:MAG: ammonium transporter [bacterium]|nr:ammonium transporter [bacterium]
MMHSETAFLINTLSFLVWGGLVMWMCAGFTMIEAGSVRTRNASVTCLKNIGLCSIAVLTYYLVGFNLMFVDVEPGGWIGALTLFQGSTPAERQLLQGHEEALDTVVATGHASMSRWLFGMVFVASSASIVSGTLAERVKLWPFFLFIVVLTGVIYPVVGAWAWGGGWLAELGFHDYAGSTVVHATGGWAALAGVLIVGARSGKFREDGTVRSTPPANIPAVTLGVFFIWLGFLGFNGASQLAFGSTFDALAVTNVLVNTNLAAAAGTLTALTVSRPWFGHVDFQASVNGAIAGLVAIAAGPDFADHAWALFIGATGALVCTSGMKLLLMLKIDDEVGAVSAHMGAGVWGTLAVCFTHDVDLLAQLAGVAAVGGFVFVSSFIVWWVIDVLLGVRNPPQVERAGQDLAELGIVAYPEFMLIDDADHVKGHPSPHP